MKYGQLFHAQSVPQWAPYNVDYNELKHLIKANTTKDQGRAVAIPGHEDTSLHKFENLFYNELSNQHDRVDLFVKSKADEIRRRLQYLQRCVDRLLTRCSYRASRGKPISAQKRDKFAKYDAQIESCGEDIRALQRFVAAQRMAFHKILKKYTKWTASRGLKERFQSFVLDDPKSFVQRNYKPLYAQYRDLLTTLRSSTPEHSAPETPTSSRPNSRRPSTQPHIQETFPRRNWNEYDDGSEAGDEPYYIYADPDAEAFPGAKAFTYVFSKVKKPFDNMKNLLDPSIIPAERRSLVRREVGYDTFNDSRSYLDPGVDTDDNTYDSATDFPSGYASYHAHIPSVNAQRQRELVLHYVTWSAFFCSLGPIAIGWLLLNAGRRKLRVEIDAGALLCIISSLFLALLAVGAHCCRRKSLRPGYHASVITAFLVVCGLMVGLGYIMMHQTAL